MTRRLFVFAGLLAIAAVGCDGGATDADAGGGLDGGSERDGGGGADATTPPPDDAGSVDDDAGSIGEDAGVGIDAGDAVDAGPPDAGAPPEPCGSPGAVESVPCGSCGTVERFCTAGGTWAYGACGGEGECAPGSTDSVSCGDCGTQTRRCTVECAWVDMGACTGEGECTPGATTTTGDGCPSGQLRDFMCNDACTFEPTSACSADACPTPGALETLPCGMCGTRERFCNASNVWEYSGCMGEGMCMPGTTGSRACGMCGTQATRCDSTCQWIDTTGTTCTGEGACSPGMRRRTDAGCPSGQTRLLECDASCAYTIVAEPCRDTVPIDVLFLPDATGSNWSAFQGQRATFINRCVDPLLAIPEVQVGLAYYGDFGTFPETFIGAVELDAGTSAAISADIASQSSIGGGDDSTMEALHILTGGAAQPGAAPFTCSAGRVDGGCWRPGAQRVIVMHTDEYAKGGPNASGPGLINPWPSGPNWDTVRPRLLTDGTLLFVILDDDHITTGDPVGQYREMISDLSQPMSDFYLEPAFTPNGIGGPCDSIVARVRALAGM